MDPKGVVAAGYDRIAEAYAAAARADVAGGSDPRRAYIALGLDLVGRRGRGLDLGCGTGEHATRFLAEALTMVGLDLSRRSVAIARRDLPTAAFVAGDMTDLPFADATFDVVTAFYSLIHVSREQQQQALTESARCLRPDGVLVATMGLVASEDHEDDWHGAPMYWSSWDAEANVALVRRSGLTVVVAEPEVTNEDGRDVGFLWVVARRAAATLSR